MVTEKDNGPNTIKEDKAHLTPLLQIIKDHKVHLMVLPITVRTMVISIEIKDHSTSTAVTENLKIRKVEIRWMSMEKLLDAKYVTQ